ncbi:hypothetical protein BOTBODRAFT_207657 [Botryobasidium botryosum FD-172 SS1]|uniref:pH-response regulator protein palC n=1 Tax=Botryobasidium botryosum (strain FD-172 SS1) TaxID=930990 RepID=A0A067N136_BOTB1|nr:hypothetical protein BOTBODRAFT_207657 [Botryobasidium botryosum FD-172 SS1]
MTSFRYELPTTGAIAFHDFCIDPTNVHNVHLADATTARASVRAVLKENKRMDGDKDHLRVIKALDDYLPHIYGILACVATDDLTLRHEPQFSWRSTLSSNLLNTSPRVNFIGLHADLAFTLLTYAFALSNLSNSVVVSLGSYELDRHIADADRRAKDERLNFAVTLLCRASGVFSHVAEVVLIDWVKANGNTQGKPPDVTKEVVTALSKLALADAQTLAIRKLMSKSAFDSTFSPGPPLPRSHPSPALIAKLYLHNASLYGSARSLAKTPGSKAATHPDGGGGDGGDGEVSADLRKYLARETALATALSHKWLGVDAGERERNGEAVAFLSWAKEELAAGRENRAKVAASLGKGKGADAKRERVAEEIERVQSFLANYKRQNDMIHFLPVPSTSELQSLIPAGVSAVAPKPFQPPTPAFGPGSIEYVAREAAGLTISTVDVESDDKKEDDSPHQKPANYALAGQYF